MDLSSASSESTDVRGSLTFMVGEIHADIKTLLNRSESHEKRIRGLERTKWWAAGIVAVYASLPKVLAAMSALGVR